MKTLRVALLAALAAGCHFDKLFSGPGGGHAPSVGSTPSQLVFTTQPHDAVLDSVIQPPAQVAALDGSGNILTSFTGNVTVAIGHDGSVTHDAQFTNSFTSVPASGGVATFSDLRIDRIGTGYTLTAAIGDGPDLTESDAFNVTPVPLPGSSPATKLAFVMQPTNTAPGATISPPVQIAAVDDQNNIVASFGGTITIAIGHNGGLLLPGTLHGTLLQPTLNGVATFTDLSIDRAGADYYTLLASDPQLSNMESLHFTVLVP